MSRLWHRSFDHAGGSFCNSREKEKAPPRGKEGPTKRGAGGRGETSNRVVPGRTQSPRGMGSGSRNLAVSDERLALGERPFLFRGVRRFASAGGALMHEQCQTLPATLLRPSSGPLRYSRFGGCEIQRNL